MSSDSESIASSQLSENTEEFSENSTDDVNEITTNFGPYQDEPLASGDDSDNEDGDEEIDADGLTPSVLAARYERRTTVDEWCKCACCSDNSLEGALEFRCCREVIHALGKLIFDGSIDRISCVTQHEDYIALTNKTNLLQVAPLLRDKTGKKYRRRPGVSENEFIRSVGYRWVVRWMCGYMGWDNCRPLSACVYNNLRTRFPSQQASGYACALDRA